MITINPFLKDTNHSLPKINVLLTKLSKGNVFSIDLASAYNQIKLDESSKKYAYGVLMWETTL